MGWVSLVAVGDTTDPLTTANNGAENERRGSESKFFRVWLFWPRTGHPSMSQKGHEASLAFEILTASKYLASGKFNAVELLHRTRCCIVDVDRDRRYCTYIQERHDKRCSEVSQLDGGYSTG